MTEKQLKKNSALYYTRLNKQGQLLLQQFDAEAVHHFRVDYKKLRAFLRMMAFAPGAGGEIKLSKQLKNIYRKAGELRELQLQLQRTSSTTGENKQSSPRYTRLLKAEIEKLKPALHEMFDAAPVKACKRETDPLLPASFLPVHFKKYAQRQWLLTANNIRAPRYNDDTLHSIRKLLKDLFYNLENYKGLARQQLSVSVCREKDEAYFGELLTALGSFQDLCNAIALLRAYWLLQLPAAERQRLENLKLQWISEKKRQRVLLVKQLRSLFLPVHK